MYAAASIITRSSYAYNISKNSECHKWSHNFFYASRCGDDYSVTSIYCRPGNTFTQSDALSRGGLTNLFRGDPKKTRYIVDTPMALQTLYKHQDWETTFIVVLEAHGLLRQWPCWQSQICQRCIPFSSATLSNLVLWPMKTKSPSL